MPFNNPFAFSLVNLRRPHVAFGGAAENDPVAPWHHVHECALRGIADATVGAIGHFLLRNQDNQLPFERNEFLIAEEGARADGRQVDVIRVRGFATMGS